MKDSKNNSPFLPCDSLSHCFPAGVQREIWAWTSLGRKKKKLDSCGKKKSHALEYGKLPTFSNSWHINEMKPGTHGSKFPLNCFGSDHTEMPREPQLYSLSRTLCIQGFLGCIHSIRWISWSFKAVKPSRHSSDGIGREEPSEPRQRSLTSNFRFSMVESTDQRFLTVTR